MHRQRRNSFDAKALPKGIVGAPPVQIRNPLEACGLQAIAVGVPHLSISVLAAVAMVARYDATFYNRDLKTVIGNYHDWLVPGGRLFIETIDRDHITENILPAESSTFVRKEGPYVVQNLAAMTPYPHGSTLTWWELLPEDYLSVYHEEIRHHDGKVEKKEHKMYLPPLAETEKLIEQAGFRLIAKERVVNDTSEVFYVFEKIISCYPVKNIHPKFSGKTKICYHANLALTCQTATTAA